MTSKYHQQYHTSHKIRKYFYPFSSANSFPLRGIAFWCKATFLVVIWVCLFTSLSHLSQICRQINDIFEKGSSLFTGTYSSRKESVFLLCVIIKEPPNVCKYEISHTWENWCNRLTLWKSTTHQKNSSWYFPFSVFSYMYRLFSNLHLSHTVTLAIIELLLHYIVCNSLCELYNFQYLMRYYYMKT